LPSHRILSNGLPIRRLPVAGAPTLIGRASLGDRFPQVNIVRGQFG